MTKKHSRRKFVTDLGLVASSLLLAACGTPTVTPTASPTTEAAKNAEKPHWTYEGAEGPAEWGKLDPAWAVCSAGSSQTPIDITGTFQPSTLTEIRQVYADTKLNIENNGHTIQVNYESGSSLTLNGKKYELAQFHFHSPSEHKINGKSFAMEVHLVHKAADGSLAVIGVLFEEGDTNQFLAKFWDKMPAKKETKDSAPISLNALEAVPANKGYYTYEGSLTTPGCSEGVRWIVMKNSITASKTQIEKFKSVIGEISNRPVQPLNGRVIGEGTF